MRRPLAGVRRRWPGRPRRSASTRSGSATTCSTAGTGARSAGRGRCGRCSPRSPRSPSGSSSGPLVACASFHPPGLIAKMAATVARGRAAGGSCSGSAPAGTRPSTAPSGCRTTTGSRASRSRSRSSGGLLAGERVTLDGRFWQADDLVVLPLPEQPIPLMIGSNGPRMLRATLPHVDRWNTWYDGYGNTVDGLRRAERVRKRAGGGRRPRSRVALPQHRGAGRARSGRRQATPLGHQKAERSGDTGWPRDPSCRAGGGRRRRGDPDPAPDRRGVYPGGRSSSSGTSRTGRAGLPYDDRLRRDVLGHDGAGADERLLADLDPGQHDRAAADSRAAADRRASRSAPCASRCAP